MNQALYAHMNNKRKMKKEKKKKESSHSLPSQHSEILLLLPEGSSILQDSSALKDI
jgi:hypothetical protein